MPLAGVKIRILKFLQLPKPKAENFVRKFKAFYRPSGQTQKLKFRFLSFFFDAKDSKYFLVSFCLKQIRIFG